MVICDSNFLSFFYEESLKILRIHSAGTALLSNRWTLDTSSSFWFHSANDKADWVLILSAHNKLGYLFIIFLTLHRIFYEIHNNHLNNWTHYLAHLINIQRPKFRKIYIYQKKKLRFSLTLRWSSILNFLHSVLLLISWVLRHLPKCCQK